MREKRGEGFLASQSCSTQCRQHCRLIFDSHTLPYTTKFHSCPPLFRIGKRHFQLNLSCHFTLGPRWGTICAHTSAMSFSPLGMHSNTCTQEGPTYTTDRLMSGPTYAHTHTRTRRGERRKIVFGASSGRAA